MYKINPKIPIARSRVLMPVNPSPDVQLSVIKQLKKAPKLAVAGDNEL
jgi:hypothetical protein